MDFSSLNPTTSNALNLAARTDDVQAVKRLLKKINPNCIDNRGWTCLHEAASEDSYDSLLLILQHPDCRPLAEDHEGCTALQVACRHSASIKTIRALLEHIPDIANYGNTENVTPLHVVSSQGRLDIMQLLLDHGAIIDVQDFDGHTALHDAALAMQSKAVQVLLCAGADPEILNDSYFTAFHFACYKGCLETVKALHLFVSNIDQITVNGDSPLMLATIGFCEDVVSFLLELGADPHVKDVNDDMALNIALKSGHSSIFKKLLLSTDKEKINSDIILYACKPHYLRVEILENLLFYDLGPEFYDLVEPFHVTLEKIGNLRPTYLTSAPLNSFLNICEYIFKQSPKMFEQYFNIFLSKGVSVNALNINECPPLVYIHYSIHSGCFIEVFKILCDHGCNVDYCTTMLPSGKEWCIPDAFIASLTSNPSTMPIMLPYSLSCEPEIILKFVHQNFILPRIPVQNEIWLIRHEHLFLALNQYNPTGNFTMHQYSNIVTAFRVPNSATIRYYKYKTCVQEYLLSLLDVDPDRTTVEKLSCAVLSLKHLCRLKVRELLRNNLGSKISSQRFLLTLNTLKLPAVIKDYLRYK